MNSLRDLIQRAQAEFAQRPSAEDSRTAAVLNEIHRSAENALKSVGSLSPMHLASLIDHTLLKPDAIRSEIEDLCGEAERYGFASVCVNSSHVALASRLLRGKKPLVVSVVGFPLGACTTATKAFEARQAVEAGASEIDMVLSIGALKDQTYDTVFEDIRAVVAEKAPVKVILETCLLTPAEIAAACVIAREAGAAFVKTSTGFSKSGATMEDVRLMRTVAGTKMKVKASGGIRSREDALKMIAAGADRLGTSSGKTIVTTTSASNSTAAY